MAVASHQRFGWSSCGLGELPRTKKLGSACSQSQEDASYGRDGFWQEIGTMLEKKQCRPGAERRKLKADDIFVGLQQPMSDRKSEFVKEKIKRRRAVVKNPYCSLSN